RHIGEVAGADPDPPLTPPGVSPTSHPGNTNRSFQVVTDMKIEIWSDVVCPWCFIGKRRLEKALAATGYDAEIVYRSFQLDPGAPTQPEQSVAEHLGAKYGGGPAAGQQMVERTEAVAAEEGLLFRLGEAQ